MEETWKKAWTGTKCCYPCGQCMHCIPRSPSGGDVVGEGRGGADLPGEAEVGDLDGVAAGRLGCNSIDIRNLRLELGNKLRQGLRMRLGMHFLAVG